MTTMTVVRVIIAHWASSASVSQAAPGRERTPEVHHNPRCPWSDLNAVQEPGQRPRTSGDDLSPRQAAVSAAILTRLRVRVPWPVQVPGAFE